MFLPSELLSRARPLHTCTAALRKLRRRTLQRAPRLDACTAVQLANAWRFVPIWHTLHAGWFLCGAEAFKVEFRQRAWLQELGATRRCDLIVYFEFAICIPPKAA